MDMPIFHKTKKNLEESNFKENVGKFVATIWKVAFDKEKESPAFLILLVRCTWWNGETSTLNKRLLTKYLGLEEEEKKDIIADKINAHWPKISIDEAKELLKYTYGITRAYGSHRPIIESFIKKNPKLIKKMFDIVSSNNISSEEKIKKSMNLLEGLPLLKAPNGGKFSLIT